MYNRFAPNPLINKPLRRIRALRKKLEHRAMYMTSKAIKEAELEIERQFKLMPKLVYEHTNPLTDPMIPAIKIEDEYGQTSYISQIEFEKKLASGEISYQ